MTNNVFRLYKDKCSLTATDSCPYKPNKTMTKVTGMIVANTFKEAIETGLSNLDLMSTYKVSQNNAFITGCKPEFDLLLLKKEAKEIGGMPLYSPSDVVAVIECKYNGYFDVRSGSTANINLGSSKSVERQVNEFMDVLWLNQSVRFGYVTMTERFPKKEFRNNGVETRNPWRIVNNLYEEKLGEKSFASYAASFYSNNCHNPDRFTPDKDFDDFIQKLITKL